MKFVMPVFGGTSPECVISNVENDQVVCTLPEGMGHRVKVYMTVAEIESGYFNATTGEKIAISPRELSAMI